MKSAADKTQQRNNWNLDRTQVLVLVEQNGSMLMSNESRDSFQDLASQMQDQSEGLNPRRQNTRVQEQLYAQARLISFTVWWRGPVHTA